VDVVSRIIGVDSTVVEFLLNVAIFVPWFILAATVWPAVPWWCWVALGLLATVVVEGYQGLLMSESRTSSASDVGANTLGALIGAALISLDRARARRAAAPRPRG
jgi:glycopeptide antibiotics resistance protein